MKNIETYKDSKIYGDIANEIKNLAKELINSYMYRKGQAMFNAAYMLYPKSSDNLRDTKYDCFYRDDLIDIFLKELVNMVNSKGKE